MKYPFTDLEIRAIKHTLKHGKMAAWAGGALEDMIKKGKHKTEYERDPMTIEDFKCGMVLRYKSMDCEHMITSVLREKVPPKIVVSGSTINTFELQDVLELFTHEDGRPLVKETTHD